MNQFKNVCLLITAILIGNGLWQPAMAANTLERIPGRVIVKFKKASSAQSVSTASSVRKSAASSTSSILSSSNAQLNQLLNKYKVSKQEAITVAKVEPQAAGAVGKLSVQSASSSSSNNTFDEVCKKYAQRCARALRGIQPPNMDDIYLLTMPDGTDTVKAAADFAQNPDIEYAQPDYIVHTSWMPSDKYLTPGPLTSTDKLWGLKKINAPTAWDTARGDGITVAVVDTGVDVNHPDIKNNILKDAAGAVYGASFAKAYDEAQDKYVDCDPTNDVMDYNGHGTHVAGTIAAEANNQIGISGVAPLAEIMPVKGLCHDGSGTISSLMKAIIYAVNNGADIISNSWGTGFTVFSQDPIMENVVNYAHALGAVMVFAAGNSNQDSRFFAPAYIPSVITVAASDIDDKKAVFSNWGEGIDISAPGVDILSLNARGGDNTISRDIAACTANCKNAIVDRDYLRISGTSMAAPHVSGLIALILSKNKNFTISDINYILRASANKLSNNNFNLEHGYGRIDAAAVLKIALTLKPVITSPENYLYIPYGTKSITIQGTIEGSALLKNYRIYYTQGWYKQADWRPITGVMTKRGKNDVLGTWNLSGVAPDSYLIRLVAETTQGAVFEDVKRVTILPAHTLLKILNGRSISYYADEGIMAWSQETPTGDEINYYDSQHGNLGVQRIANPPNPRSDTGFIPFRPFIHNRKIIFEYWSPIFSRAYIYDLDHPGAGAQPVKLNTEEKHQNDPLLVTDPITSHECAAWSFSVQGPQSTWDTYLLINDLTTHESKQITLGRNIPTVANGRNLHVYDHKIFFYVLGEGTKFYDLAHPELGIQLLSTWLMQDIQQDSDTMVLRKNLDDGTSNLKFLNLKTKAEKIIPGGGIYQEYFGVIAGTSSVYAAMRNGLWSLVSNNFFTNKQYNVTDNSGYNFFMGITNKTLFYHTYRSGKWELYKFDIPAPQITTAVQNNYTADVQKPLNVSFNVSPGWIEPVIASTQLADGRNISDIGARFTYDAPTRKGTFSFTPQPAQASQKYDFLFTLLDPVSGLKKTQSMTAQVTGPTDITIPSIQIGPSNIKVGGISSMAIAVKNQGAFSTLKPFIVRVTVANNGVQENFDTTIAAMPAGQTLTKRINVRMSKKGWNVVDIKVDPANLIAETNETNNLYVFQMYYYVLPTQYEAVIKGKVVDANDQPMANVLVNLNTKSMRSNTDGTFQFDNVTAGNYTVKITGVTGFAPASIRVDAAEQRTEITFKQGALSTPTISNKPFTTPNPIPTPRS